MQNKATESPQEIQQPTPKRLLASTIDGVELSERDLSIIELISQDMTDKEIAAEMSIAVSTLGHHKKKLYKKTGTITKVSLIMKAMRCHVLMV